MTTRERPPAAPSSGGDRLPAPLHCTLRPSLLYASARRRCSCFCQVGGVLRIRARRRPARRTNQPLNSVSPRVDVSRGGGGILVGHSRRWQPARRRTGPQRLWLTVPPCSRVLRRGGRAGGAQHGMEGARHHTCAPMSGLNGHREVQTLPATWTTAPGNRLSSDCTRKTRLRRLLCPAHRQTGSC